MKSCRLLVLSLCLALAGLARSAEPVFDTHVHLRDGETSLQKFEAEVREAGIELAGVGAMWFGGPHQALAGDPAKMRASNDALIALAAKHPEVAPIGTVHPYDGKAALDELARIAARGVKTLKIHPHTQRFEIADPRVLALVTKAGELGMTVLMDNAGIVPGDCEDLFNLAARAPKTRFIFAHMGGANFRFWNILVLARTADGFALDNANFDISGTVLLAADTPIEAEFIWTLRNIGIDHVMLGSDYPQISLARTVEALEKLDLTREEKMAILSGNARRILGRGNGS
ncbi:MAG TPA: amidohydrolase family protein [Steroidobacteraceae bacterium]|jgi:predicted TIM-barrel fold metal-dependent hydrolase|nr:amidohydrolase family protein [Steroidobacteraceae bacterium]